MPACHRNSWCSESQVFGVTEVCHFNGSNFRRLWAIINFSFGSGEKKKKKKKDCPEQSQKKLNCALQVVEIQLICWAACCHCPAAVLRLWCSGLYNPEPWLWEEVSKERRWNYMSSSFLLPSPEESLPFFFCEYFQVLSISLASLLASALLKSGYMACWVQRFRLSSHSLNVDENTEFWVSCLNRLNFNCVYISLLFILGSWISEMKTLLNYACI